MRSDGSIVESHNRTIVDGMGDLADVIKERKRTKKKASILESFMGEEK